MTPESDRKVLEAARIRIQQGWTRQADARDSAGNPCSHDAPQAVCWCILGALMVETGCVNRTLNIASVLKHVGGIHMLGDFNDSATKDEVLALIDRTLNSRVLP